MTSAAREGSEDAVGTPLTEADVAAEQTEATAFSLARLEGELAEIRTQLEAMKEEGGRAE